MKPSLLTFAYVLLLLLLISCATGGRSRTMTYVDGRVEKDTSVYAQLGGNGGFVAQGDGGFALQFNGEKSFGQAMTALGTAVAVTSYAAVEKAKSAATAATSQAGINAGAATEQARIGATAATATSLGNNPEANVGAINAVGGLFKR